MNRYLVVSDLMVGSTQLKEFVRDRTGGDGSRFHLVVPTMPDRRHLAWDESEAHLIARRRLVNGLEWMREIDPSADGEIGDVDPILAIEDALRTTDYDAIVLAARALVLGGPTAHYVFWALFWCTVILVIFVPLGVRTYRRAI